MAKKNKKKTASSIPVEVTVAAVTVTDVDSSCCCGHVFQKQLCDRNLALGNERWCVEKEDSSVSNGAEAIAVAAEPESGFEAEAATGATAASEEDSCCELFRKLNIGLFEAYSCLEQTHAVEGLGEGAGAAAEVATGEALNTEAAVGTEADDKCQCRDNSEKLWCEEYLKLGMGRRCTELRKLLENRNSGVNIGTVNHFKIIWHKDGVL